MKRLALLLPLVAACAGVPGPSAPDGGLADSGRPDAGPVDGGPVDAGGPDASVPDAGPADGGLTDGGVPDAGTSLCAPSGNLIVEGSLDKGLSGLAPVGWEVRTPGRPNDCLASGTPAEHVFASSPAPGCSGRAVTVDARGAWDCYAVQTVSPYNSIQGGATYRIRAVARSSGNAVNPAAWFFLGVQWLDGNDAFFGDEKNPRPATSAGNDFDWKVVEWELVAPAQARRVLVWLTAHYPGKVEFDHVAVVKK